MLNEREEPSGALVRPYAVTRGRTRPRRDIAIEALLETTPAAQSEGPLLGNEQQHILGICGQVQSLAEVAARMSLPLGVARVLVADLAEDGLLAIYEPTTMDVDDFTGTDLLERVLSGLRRL